MPMTRASNRRGLRSSGMRAMMKSWRDASSSRASTALVSTCRLISIRGKFLRMRRIAGTASPMDGAVTEPMKTVPPRPDFRSAISRSMPRSSSSIVRARRASASPNDVSSTPRGSRLQSGTPRRSSMSPIMRDAAGCDTFRIWAAALTCPVSWIATIMRMCVSFSPLLNSASVSSSSRGSSMLRVSKISPTASRNDIPKEAWQSPAIVFDSYID